MVWSNEFPPTFDVGTPGAGHMHFGNDGSMTLYGPDGVTVEASLDPVNGLQVFKGTITGALVQTAATGRRLAMDGPGNAFTISSGATGETAGDLTMGYAAAAGNVAPYIELDAPYVGDGVQATLRLQSSSPNGHVIPRQLIAGVDLADIGSMAHFDNAQGAGQLSFDGAILTVPSIQSKALTAWVPVLGEINNWNDDGTGGGGYRAENHWFTGLGHSRTSAAGTYPDPWGLTLPATPVGVVSSGAFNSIGNPLASIIGSWAYRRASDGATWSGPLVYTKNVAQGGPEAGPMLAGGGLFSLQPGAGDSVTVNLSYAVA